MAAASGTTTLTGEQRMENLKVIARDMEIPTEMVMDLRSVENYEVVFIIDDSGSMNAAIPATDPFALPQTRWTELQDTVTNIIKIVTCFDPDGVDLYFLNRPPVKNVISVDQVKGAFTKLPSGYTPLVQAMSFAVKEKVSRESKPLLMIVATDGVPTDVNGKLDKDGFKTWLKKRDADRIRMSILACSDRDEDVGYLDKLDKDIKNLDVSDDYKSEYEQYMKLHKDGTFTRGAYYAKAVLGGILAKYDNQDEKKNA